MPSRFALRYIVIAAILFSLYAFPYDSFGIAETWFETYLAGYARLVGVVLGVLEPGVSVQNTVITGRTSLQIVKSCDAMEAKLLFASAILAFPAPVPRKAMAILGGLLALTVLNVLRITTLYYFVLESQRVFEVAHVEIWPLLMILATCALFFSSVRLMQLQPRGSDAPLSNGAA